MTAWDKARVRETYNIKNWSNGYFDVDDKGNLTVNVSRDATAHPVALVDIVDKIRDHGLTLPILMRFSDILHDRVEMLIAAFEKATKAQEYCGSYTAVYPIKVNQQRHVVEEIIKDRAEAVGLEAGSKPELMAVLAVAPDQSVIVCNGYKDRDYIRLALIGQKLGHRVYIVIEQPSEFDVVLDEAQQLNVEPVLGVRVRLASIGHGKWQNTGGEKSKFGLSAAQTLKLIATLREHDKSHCLQLLHCHLGSQIANVRDIQRGMREISRYYAEMHRNGVKIDVIDVGGGLGVDYEGSRSRSDCSMNYTVDEYAHNVIRPIVDICQELELPHPDIITESGRAMTAHHAVLITNVTDVELVNDGVSLTAPDDDAPIMLHDIWQCAEAFVAGERTPLEVYHELVHLISEVHATYTHGLLSLEQRAWAEQVHSATSLKIRKRLQSDNKNHREVIDELDGRLVDKYFCNFSLFQSMPDAWAIDQIFPVVPLHRLLEKPTHRGVLQDLTCDSDGRIERYVEKDGVNTSLRLHKFFPDSRYLLGMFMVGAYQEILGDLHNLFGDTDAVNVSMLPSGEFELTQPVSGDTVEDVLRFVRFARSDLAQQYKRKVTKLELTAGEKRALLVELEAGLASSTYLDSNAG